MLSVEPVIPGIAAIAPDMVAVAPTYAQIGVAAPVLLVSRA